MRVTTLLFVLVLVSGCTAMMVGGGGAKTYPPATECPEGQTRTENGCEA